MRGSWGKQYLENDARRVVDRAETIDGVAAGKEFETWVELLLTTAEVRRFVTVLGTYSYRHIG